MDQRSGQGLQDNPEGPTLAPSGVSKEISTAAHLELEKLVQKGVIVPADPQDLLQLWWKNMPFRFSCLPFGLTSALRLFTKILKPVIAYLRKGISLIVYIDDILIIADTEELARRHAQLTWKLLEWGSFPTTRNRSWNLPNGCLFWAS